jgi:hypothetical protein
VLEGEHVYRVDDEEFRVGPGGLVFAPRGVPHSQRRVVAGEGRQLVLVSPGGLEVFFRELAAAHDAGTLGPDAYASASRRYGLLIAAFLPAGPAPVQDPPLSCGRLRASRDLGK